MKSNSIGIDLTAPELGSIINPDDGKWVTHNVNVDIESPIDRHSGTCSLFVSINDEEFVPYYGKISVFEEGIYKVSYYAEDSLGNRSEIVSSEFAVDRTAPEVNPGDVNSIQSSSNANAFVDDIEFIDNLDTDLDIKVVGIVNTSVVGNYTLEYTVKDKAGNTTTYTKEVEVYNYFSPVMSAPAGEIYIDVFDTFTDPGVTVTDAYGTQTIYGTHNVNTQVLGTYKISYTYVDKDGHEAYGEIKVYVVDREGPVLNFDEQKTTINEKTKFDPYKGVTWTDNYDKNVTVVIEGKVNYNKAGKYTITYVATDSSGNETRVERTIKVLAGTSVGLIIGCSVGGVVLAGGGIAAMLVIKKKKKLA
jgi:hypothetical protein